MTKIKITREVGGHNVGDEIEVTRGVAEYLTTEGYAEEAAPARSTAKSGATKD